MALVKLPSGGYGIPFHPFTGIDLRSDPKYRKAGKFHSTFNFVPYKRGALAKRKGTTILNSVAWTNVTKVPFGMRFYPTGGTAKKLVYVNKAAGDEIGQVHDTTGAYTALTGLPALTANKRANACTFGETQAAYFGNDANGIIKSTDGVAGAALTGTHIPAACYMANTPYYDRLVAFHGKRVPYTRTNLDNDWSDPTTGNPQYVWVNHPEDISAVFTPGPYKSDAGYISKLYICTPTSTWVKHLDFGDNLGPVQIHDTAGISNVNTVASIDKGAIGMGTETVWAFPLDGLPVDIGQDLGDTIKNLSFANKLLCGAAYHDGFYKLFGPFSGTSTTWEYWADVRGLLGSGSRYPVEWYGPMARLDFNIRSMFSQVQSPDTGELFALSGSEGRIYATEAAAFVDGSGDGSIIAPYVEVYDYKLPGLSEVGVNGIMVGAEQTRLRESFTMVLLGNGASFNITSTALVDCVGGMQPEYIVTTIRPSSDRQRARSVYLKLTENMLSTPLAFTLKELWLLVQPFGRL